MGAIECECVWAPAYAKGTRNIAGAIQLRDAVAKVVCDPQVRAIESDPCRASAHAKGTYDIARGIQLRHVVVWIARDPNMGARLSLSPELPRLLA